MKPAKTKSPEGSEDTTAVEVEESVGRVVVEDSSRTAKRDFTICHNEYYREIKTGDSIADVPEKFLPNLKTEEVI